MLNNMKTFLILLSLFIGLYASSALAIDLTNNFNFEGTLVDSSNNPITTSVSVVFDIYDPSASCLLFEETQASITPDGISRVLGQGPSGSIHYD